MEGGEKEKRVEGGMEKLRRRDGDAKKEGGGKEEEKKEGEGRKGWKRREPVKQRGTLPCQKNFASHCDKS